MKVNKYNVYDEVWVVQSGKTLTSMSIHRDIVSSVLLQANLEDGQWLKDKREVTPWYTCQCVMGRIMERKLHLTEKSAVERVKELNMDID